MSPNSAFNPKRRSHIIGCLRFFAFLSHLSTHEVSRWEDQFEAYDKVEYGWKGIETVDLIIFKLHVSSQRCLLLVKTPTQSGSRFLWWNGSARMKPASTQPLNISRSIASVFASGVKCTVVWKDKPVEDLESVAAFAGANPSRSNLIKRYLSFWRREVKADLYRISC